MRYSYRRLFLHLPVSLLVLAMVSIGIAGALRISVRARAIQVIEDHDGSVETLPLGPSALQDWIGPDRMQPLETAVAVDLGVLSGLFSPGPPPDISDADLAHIIVFRELKKLDLASSKITDAGLEHIARLPQLEHLALGPCPGVTDAGLMKLEPLTHLQELKLMGNFDGSGLLHLADLKEMTSLTLYRITGDPIEPPLEFRLPVDVQVSLQALSQWPQIAELAVCTNQVGDAGLWQIGKLQHLEKLGFYCEKGDSTNLQILGPPQRLRKLELDGDGITDRRIEWVGDLVDLEELEITNSPEISDTGLRFLEGLTKLRSLVIYNTKVTQAGIDELQRRLPRAQIEARFADPE
jgi:Leucine Rich repeat